MVKLLNEKRYQVSKGTIEINPMPSVILNMLNKSMYGSIRWIYMVPTNKLLVWDANIPYIHGTLLNELFFSGEWPEVGDYKMVSDQENSRPTHCFCGYLQFRKVLNKEASAFEKVKTMDSTYGDYDYFIKTLSKYVSKNRGLNVIVDAPYHYSDEFRETW